MEATTATPSHTGSRTIADLLPRAAELFGEQVAVKHKAADGGWHELTFAEAGGWCGSAGRGGGSARVVRPSRPPGAGPRGGPPPNLLAPPASGLDVRVV